MRAGAKLPRLVVRVLFAALCLTGAVSRAQAQAGEPPEAVPLNRLLKLPAGAPVEAVVEKRGGHTKPQWQARFLRGLRDVTEAHEALERTREKLSERMGEESAWRMGAPGLGGVSADSPVDYKLTQELRRNRQELARAERQLQDLEVEANLAGVPPDWRGEAPEAAGRPQPQDAQPETGPEASLGSGS